MWALSGATDLDNGCLVRAAMLNSLLVPAKKIVRRRPGTTLTAADGQRSRLTQQIFNVRTARRQTSRMAGAGCRIKPQGNGPPNSRLA